MEREKLLRLMGHVRDAQRALGCPLASGLVTELPRRLALRFKRVEFQVSRLLKDLGGACDDASAE